MKKILCLLFSLMIIFTLCSCAVGNNDDLSSTAPALSEKVTVNIAVLKGPTGMGAAYLMKRNEENEAANKYIFSIENAPDAITGQLVSGALDIAAVPSNLAAVIKNKGAVNIKIIAVNTLGVLYLLEKGDSISKVSDLNGKKVITSGKGSTAKVIIQKLFGNTSAEITYASEHTEAVTLAASGSYDICILPEPFVTTLLSKNIGYKIALDLTKEWKNAKLGSLPMGCLVARNDFIENNPAAIEAFLDEYASSVEYANTNIPDASAIIEKYGIMPAAVAKMAIPGCNMVLITGNEMKSAVKGFFDVINGFNKALIGGAVPSDDIFYFPN